MGKARVRVTINGQPKSVTVPSTTQRVYLGTDGSQRVSAGSGATTFGVQALGSLPPSAAPVPVGFSWTSKATVTLPSSLGASLPPFQVTTAYTLTNLQPRAADGHIIATIKVTNSAPFSANTTVQGVAVTLRVRETTAGQTLFDATAGRLVSSAAKQLLHLSIGQGGTAAGSGGVIGEDITSDTALQPA